MEGIEYGERTVLVDCYISNGILFRTDEELLMLTYRIQFETKEPFFQEHRSTVVFFLSFCRPFLYMVGIHPMLHGIALTIRSIFQNLGRYSKQIRRKLLTFELSGAGILRCGSSSDMCMCIKLAFGMRRRELGRIGSRLSSRQSKRCV